jgi:hypothetical protein
MTAKQSQRTQLIQAITYGSGLLSSGFQDIGAGDASEFD